VCSGALRSDQYGRLVVVITSGDQRTTAGRVFVVVEIFEPRGRAPSARERESTRAPYNSNSANLARQERAKVPDELLADEEAVRLAYAEQRRAPPDLVNVGIAA
jgi:hypothetical protein